MTETTTIEATTEGDLEGSKEVIESTDFQSLYEQMKSESAKNRRLFNEVRKERDELKRTKNSAEDTSWENLYKQSQSELERVIGLSKANQIKLAIKEGLLKQGVLPDAVNDAVKLVDSSMVNWDAEDGVDQFSVDSAIKALRGASKYLFETKIPPSGIPKQPKPGIAETNEITRMEWNKLPNPQAKAAAAKKFKIID
jgi:hypothetical protein